MAFKPSYNIMDRDTHNALVNAFQTGGIAYTDDDGTVHKIADDYINGGGGGDAGYDVIIKVNTTEGDFVNLEVIKDSDDVEASFITDPSSVKAFVYNTDTDVPGGIMPCFASAFSYDGNSLSLYAYNNYVSGNRLIGYSFVKVDGEWVLD